MHRKKVAILQSSYIPWIGFFDIVNMADEFILYDDVQFTRRDWRSRNKIKSPTGTQWLSIPVQSKGKYYQNICDVKVSHADWPRKHWEAIYHNYRSAPYFNLLSPILHQCYQACETLSNLSHINELFITTICDVLGITTKITHSADYGFTKFSKTDRLAKICQKAAATTYLSGPAAKNYLIKETFAHINIAVEYMDYDGYRPYQQLYDGFERAVSIIDLLFNTGDDAANYLTVAR